MTDEDLLILVSKWFEKNSHLFRLDIYFGIDLQTELFRLAKEIRNRG